MLGTRSISVLVGLTAVLALTGKAAAEKPNHIDPITGVYSPKLVVLPSFCPGPDCTAELRDPSDPYALGHRVVYLNFEGVTLTRSTTNDDARNNISAMVVSNKTLPAFSTGGLNSTGGLSRQEIIDETVDQLNDSYSAYDVEFVTTRPSEGSYHMIVFVGPNHDCNSTTGNDCVGIALRDCGDTMPNNIVFVFTWGLRWQDLASTAAHEGGHAFGLDHILNNNAIMYPSVQSGFIPTQFLSGQLPANDAGDACPSNASGFQDSAATLMDNIGPRGQDVIGPSVDITSPANGAVVVPGTQVAATITDNQSVTEAELLIDGETVETKNSAPWSFKLPLGLTPGEHLLTVQAYDLKGNAGFDRIGVSVEANAACSGSSDCPADFECKDNLCVPATSPEGNLGATCAGGEDCDSGQCGMVGEESRCTRTCNDATNPCPSGFACLQGAACWPASDEGGCAISSVESGSDDAPLGFLVLGIAVLLAVRRRS